MCTIVRLCVYEHVCNGYDTKSSLGGRNAESSWSSEKTFLSSCASWASQNILVIHSHFLLLQICPPLKTKKFYNCVSVHYYP